jgi:hypothetical protein
VEADGWTSPPQVRLHHMTLLRISWAFSVETEGGSRSRAWELQDSSVS